MSRSGRKTKTAWRLARAAALVFLLVFLLIAGGRDAMASDVVPAPIRISDDLHEGCPNEPPMMARLQEQRAIVREADADEPAMSLHFRIERRDGVSHGTLTLDVGGESVERVASSRSCADVVAALSMMAAIAIGERRASAPSDTRAVVANTPPRAAQPKKRKAVVRPPRSERLGLAFGAGFETSGNHGGVFFGTWFAQITFAGRIAPALRIGLSRSMRERVSSLRGSASVQWSELTVAPCADLFVHGALRFGPCVNLEIGVIDASVLAPLPARSFSYLWLTAGGSARLAWRVLSSLSVDLIAGARAPLARSELYFEQDTDSPVYRAPPLIPFVGVAFVAHAR